MSKVNADPAFLRPIYRVFTADRMREYGAAEYKRGLEDATKVCASWGDGSRCLKLAALLRKLGAAL